MGYISTASYRAACLRRSGFVNVALAIATAVPNTVLGRTLALLIKARNVEARYNHRLSRAHNSAKIIIPKEINDLAVVYSMMTMTILFLRVAIPMRNHYLRGSGKRCMST